MIPLRAHLLAASFVIPVATMMIVVALPGCGSESVGPPSPALQEPTGPPWFEDVTDRLGISFTHDPGSLTGNYPLPQINGSGCAVGDLDGDGKPDLLFLSHGGAQSPSINRLYWQKTDGTFEDVSVGSGLDFAGFCMGVAVGDIDNDGKPDVLITLYGGVRLFRNCGGMKFQDISAEATVTSRGWATSACFVDYDRDGRLDLVVVHGVDFDPSWSCSGPDGKREYCSPNVFPGSITRLFHNETTGNTPRFRDVSLASGLGRLPGPGLGVVCADFDGDGWPDIFVANDARPNRLWMNKHDGTFVDEAPNRGVATNAMGQAWAGMGVALGDIDDDGLQDILVSHLGIETNTLWSQSPQGYFRDKTMAAKVAGGAWRGTGWGITLSDFDQDGRLDTAVVNGRVNRGAESNPDLGAYWSPYAERNQLFAGTGMGQFRDRSIDETAFCGTSNVARGLAIADIDGDGAIDLVVTTLGSRARIYRNVCPNRGHWLIVRCIDPSKGGRDASGAEVVVSMAGNRRFRIADSSGSFLCSSDPRAHFGLGSVALVESIEVRWPDGSREAYPGCAADQSLTLRKGSGQLKPPS